MTGPHDSIARPAQRTNGRWRYLALFGVQTTGVVILFLNAVPLYQQILADPSSYEAGTDHLTWVFSSIVLMQVGYWISDRVRPPLPRFTNALLGHVTLFLARMSFVLPTSIFGFLFFAEKPGFHIPVFRYVITLLGLFSLYCYTRELERLGGAFLSQEKKPTPASAD